MKIMKIELYSSILALKYLINVSIFLMITKLKFINLNVEVCKYNMNFILLFFLYYKFHFYSFLGSYNAYMKFLNFSSLT